MTTQKIIGTGALNEVLAANVARWVSALEAVQRQTGTPVTSAASMVVRAIQTAHLPASMAPTRRLFAQAATQLQRGALVSERGADLPTAINTLRAAQEGLKMNNVQKAIIKAAQGLGVTKAYDGDLIRRTTGALQVRLNGNIIGGSNPLTGNSIMRKAAKQLTDIEGQLPTELQGLRGNLQRAVAQLESAVQNPPASQAQYLKQAVVALGQFNQGYDRIHPIGGKAADTGKSLNARIVKAAKSLGVTKAVAPYFDPGGIGLLMMTLREISTDCAHGATQGGQKPQIAQQACRNAWQALNNFDETRDPTWVANINRMADFARDGAKDPSAAKSMCQKLVSLADQYLRALNALE